LHLMAKLHMNLQKKKLFRNILNNFMKQLTPIYY